MNSCSSPSELRVDMQGKLKILRQADLDGLLSGNRQDAIDARRHVRTLVIQGDRRIPEEWLTLPSLQHLSITVNKETLVQFPRVLCASALPALQRLSLLCVSRMGASEWACPVLEGRFEQLNEITIEGFAMKMNALDALLLQLPSLTTLRLWKNKIGAEGCLRLAQSLQQHGSPRLSVLDLSANDIGPVGCAALGQALELHACPDLSVLDLEQNNIGDEGCAHLARALQQPSVSNVSRIRLGLQCIGADDCAGVARTLRRWPCIYLTHLNLAANDIGSQGCAYLAQALQQHACPNLCVLALEDNDIGNQGIIHLARGCNEGCPRIQEQLDLWDNGLHTPPDVVGELRSLTALSVDYNRTRGIPPTPYGLISKLETFKINCNSLEEKSRQASRKGLEALKRYLRRRYAAAE